MNRTTLEFHRPPTPRPAFKTTPRKSKRRKRQQLSFASLMPPVYLDADFFRRYKGIVEKNYEKSTLKEYRFPRHQQPTKAADEQKTDGSLESSIESMKGVSSYKLGSQNKKPKRTVHMSATQRVFGNCKEDVLKVFKTEPKSNVPKNLHRRSASPMFMAGLQTLEIRARKTQDRRIFFTKTARFRILNHSQRKTQRTENPEETTTKPLLAGRQALRTIH